MNWSMSVAKTKNKMGKALSPVKDCVDQCANEFQLPASRMLITTLVQRKTGSKVLQNTWHHKQHAVAAVVCACMHPLYNQCTALTGSERKNQTGGTLGTRK